jgi:hypothetical protein
VNVKYYPNNLHLMKRIITAIIILWSIQNVNGQYQYGEKTLAPYVGLIVNNEKTLENDIRYFLKGEVGMLYGKPDKSIGSCSSGEFGSYFKLGTEFNAGPDRFILGPKVGYEFSLLILGGRISIVDYTDFKTQDIRLVPEVGISLLGRANLFYGFNIHLNENRFQEISRNRVTLSVNFVGW